jgi:hypothetical protein
MKNLYTITNNQIKRQDSNIVRNVEDMTNVDISNSNYLIDSLRILSVKDEYLKDLYFIDPETIIDHISNILYQNNNPNIYSNENLTLIEYIQIPNKNLFKLKFEKLNHNYQINNQIDIIIERQNKMTIGFRSIIESITENTFTIKEKLLQSDLISNIQNSPQEIIFKLINSSPSYNVDYDQILIISLAAIQNLSKRIKELEDKI